MSEGPDPTVSPRSRRVLLAILPTGIALLIAWAVWLVVVVAIGDGTQRGMSIVSGILGLVTSLTLIVSGVSYRRALRRQ